MGPTQIAILAFLAVAALGPLYTVAGYSPVANVISELAAQNTKNNFIMAAAFVALGCSVAFDGLRTSQRALLPFVAFGIAFAAAGLFGHKPVDPSAPFLAWVDSAHSTLARVSGISLTVGFLWQALMPGPPVSRTLAFSLALVCVGFPLLMLQMPSVQGLTQRCMYLLVFGWLFLRYPRHTRA